MKRTVTAAMLLLLVLLFAGCRQETAPEAVPESGSSDRQPIPMLSEPIPNAAETSTEEISAESHPSETEVHTTENRTGDEVGTETTEPAGQMQTSEPKEPSTAETTKPAEAKPTQPPKSTEPPKATEPPKQTEPPKESEAPKPSEPSAPSEPPASSEAPTEPTKAPTEPPKQEIDTAALEAYGNQYAASLGFAIDYSMTTGNSGYFPPETWLLDSMDKGKRMIRESVTGTRDYLMAYVGNIDGARCRVIVTENGNGSYTCTVLYG